MRTTPKVRSSNVALSILIPAKIDSHDLRLTISRLVNFFQEGYAGRFEVILALNGDAEALKRHGINRNGAGDASEHLLPLCEEFPELRLVFSCPAGKGLALKRAFEASRGDYILWTDADLPFDLNFFTEAIAHFEQGYDFVSGDRRHPESQFEIAPIAETMIKRRARCSTVFNFFVRKILGLRIKDTQCGIKAMRRPLAREAFGRQRCPGFLADLEYFLVCRNSGGLSVERPIRWNVQDDQSTVRLTRQFFVSIVWLIRIALANLTGRYTASLDRGTTVVPYQEIKHRMSPLVLTADDWGMSPGVNDGILALAKAGIVRRVSVLADGPYLHHGLRDLLAVPGVEVGLHFALTYPSEPLVGKKLGSLKSFASWLIHPLQSLKSKRELIREEWERQTAVFEAAQIPLSYVDSHHHVHIFPIVSSALLPLIAGKGFREVRWPFDARLFWSGKFVLNLFCLWALPSFIKSGIARRPFLYPSLAEFEKPQALQRMLTQFSRKILRRKSGSGRGEVIVHPAAYEDFASLGIQDSYGRERVVEFDALKAVAAMEGWSTAAS